MPVQSLFLLSHGDETLVSSMADWNGGLYLMPRVVLGLLCLALLLSPQLVRAQEPVGERVLQQRAVVLSMPHLNGYASCLGFRIAPNDFPSDINLVMTAAHCVRNLSSKSVIV